MKEPDLDEGRLEELALLMGSFVDLVKAHWAGRPGLAATHRERLRDQGVVVRFQGQGTAATSREQDR